MDKNEVIKILLNEQTCVKTADTCDRDCAKCPLIMDSEKIIEAYNLAIKLLSEPQWIPCSERLPFAEYGESDNVLATCEFRNADDTSYRWVKTLYFNGGVWCYPTGETYEQKVIAWMPLPKPWRGEEHD